MRLLQLVSPALPVGAYAYSQGMEYAVHADWIHDEASAQAWIEGVLGQSLARLDAPVLLRLHRAWTVNDQGGIAEWNAFLVASRESYELQTEDRQLAQALARLLKDLGVEAALPYLRAGGVSYATLFALAAVHWGVGAEDALHGYLWSWAENQVAAAIKLVPLGQTAGQRILFSVGELIPVLVAEALCIDDEDIGQVTQGLAMASAWHETQYTRLFRS